ncbi:hypothetical protein BJ508DRAFT_412804 [Ascobolus immersus RN42]|uniref:Uncharacterized protein n=1 Tax=Ascobolus immersus RN42 TaxID=1160509 RepID=A0A3N4IJW1_ASCIM|nr:hypothetical protein BJ508DRAFT_412804 [Ascobolus immersus RN42]
MASSSPDSDGSLDFQVFDPVEVFRSKLRELQHPRETPAPTILTKIISAIDPHDPSCDHLIDEAQVAVRRVGHRHTEACQKDPQVHETEALETGYPLPLYEVYGVTPSHNASPFSLDDLRSRPFDPIPESETDIQFELPTTCEDREKKDIELVTEDGSLNIERYAKWACLPIRFRARKIVEWLSAVEGGPTGSFYVATKAPSARDTPEFKDHSPETLAWEYQQEELIYILLNARRITHEVGWRNRMVNALLGYRRPARPTSTGQAGLPTYYVDCYRHRSRVPLPGLERDFHQKTLSDVKPDHRVLALHRHSILQNQMGVTYSSLASLYTNQSVHNFLIRNDSNKWPTTASDPLQSEWYEMLPRACTRSQERRSLLLVCMREVCRVVHHWARVRTAAEEVLEMLSDDCDEERRTKNAIALVKEYGSNKFVDYIGTIDKFHFFISVSTFIRICRAPSVEERIFRYLYEVEY